MQAMAKALPEPFQVLVAVGEQDLQPTLAKIPANRRGRLGLLQNELLPRNWRVHDINNPTVVSVWFEKKKPQDYKVLTPSPVYGPRAGVLEEALTSLDIPARELHSEEALEFELVRRNVYILTTNISGLVIGGTVNDLWCKHEALAVPKLREIYQTQAK